MTSLSELKRDSILDFDYVITTFWEEQGEQIDLNITKANLAAQGAFLCQERQNPSEEESPLVNVLQVNYRSGNVLRVFLTLEHNDKGKIIGIEGIDVGYASAGHLERVEYDVIKIKGVDTPILFDDQYIGNHDDTSMHINEFVRFLLREETF